MKRKLLVAKGTFAAMRGAERDLIRNLPALARIFDLTMATLQPSHELKDCARKSGIRLLSVDPAWYQDGGALTTILNSDLKSSYRAWRRVGGLK